MISSKKENYRKINISEAENSVLASSTSFYGASINCFVRFFYSIASVQTNKLLFIFNSRNSISSDLFHIWFNQSNKIESILCLLLFMRISIHVQFSPIIIDDSSWQFYMQKWKSIWHCHLPLFYINKDVHRKMYSWCGGNALYLNRLI